MRAAQRAFTDSRIRAVPAVILNGRYLISGGQPPDVFEDALRQLAQQPATRNHCHRKLTRRWIALRNRAPRTTMF